MPNRVQGEGDYESARRYNSRARRFVESTPDAATRKAGGGVDENALRKVRAKARGGAQDKQDARIIRSKVAGRKSDSDGTRSRSR